MVESDVRDQQRRGAAITESAWRKASFCAGGECLEVSRRNGMVLLRDSKNPDGSALRCTAEEWQSFVRGIKAGEFDDLGC